MQYIFILNFKLFRFRRAKCITLNPNSDLNEYNLAYNDLKQASILSPQDLSVKTALIETRRTVNDLKDKAEPFRGIFKNKIKPEEACENKELRNLNKTDTSSDRSSKASNITADINRKEEIQEQGVTKSIEKLTIQKSEDPVIKYEDTSHMNIERSNKDFEKIENQRQSSHEIHSSSLSTKSSEDNEAFDDERFKIHFGSGVQSHLSENINQETTITEKYILSINILIVTRILQMTNEQAEEKMKEINRKLKKKSEFYNAYWKATVYLIRFSMV